MNIRVAQLSDVCEINPPAPKGIPDDACVSFLSMSSVSEHGYIEQEEARRYADVKKGYTYFERGDVLIAKITPCFENGKAAATSKLSRQIGFGSTEFHVIRPSPEIDAKYVFYLLWNDRFRKTASEGMTGSAGQKRVPAELLKRLRIPLPPLAEQRRIAAILDKADALRQKRKKAIELLDSLTQSIFLEMFGNPASNPYNWPEGNIGDLLESANYGTSGKAGADGDLPILRMGNITIDGRIDVTDLKFITLPKADIHKYTVRRNDILFNRTNSAELVGKTAVFDLDREYAFAGYLVRARTKPQHAPQYVSAYLNSVHGKSCLRSMAKSIVGMANINAKEMQKIRIAIPPTDLQAEFANKLLSVEVMRDRLVPQVSAMNSLFSSLQHRAFSGQL